jgi:hypothetical protein
MWKILERNFKQNLGADYSTGGHPSQYTIETMIEVLCQWDCKCFTAHNYSLNSILFDRFKNLRAFSFVRDPIDKLISSYNYLRTRPQCPDWYFTKLCSLNEIITKIRARASSHRLSSLSPSLGTISCPLPIATAPATPAPRPSGRFSTTTGIASGAPSPFTTTTSTRRSARFYAAATFAPASLAGVVLTASMSSYSPSPANSVAFAPPATNDAPSRSLPPLLKPSAPQCPTGTLCSPCPAYCVPSSDGTAPSSLSFFMLPKRY